MKRLLIVTLMPLLLCGASLSPIGADLLKDGSGGVLLDGAWYSRKAAPLDDGRILFIGRNCLAGYTDYTAMMIADGDKIGIVRHGAISSYVGLLPNDNWNVFALGRRGLYGTISFFNETAFLYVSDGSAGVYALMVFRCKASCKRKTNCRSSVSRPAATERSWWRRLPVMR